MAYRVINVGTGDNIGDGETLSSAMSQTNDNDVYIEGLIADQTASRVSELVTCAKISTSNVFIQPNSFDGFQILKGNAVTLDFDPIAPHNFYIPYASSISLIEAINMDICNKPHGWILTEGTIVDWGDQFIESEEYTKPQPRSLLHDGEQNLYLYFALSANLVMFKNYKISIPGGISGVDPVVNLQVTQQVTQLLNGSYVTRLYITWTENPASVAAAFKVVVINAKGTVYDSEVLSEEVLVTVIDNDILHTIAVYTTNGIDVSPPSTVTITPIGNITQPDAVTNFTGYQLGARVHLTWEQPVDAPEVAQFEVRYGIVGVAWADSELVVVTSSTSVGVFDLPYGAYDFLIKTIDNEGLYSTNDSRTSITITENADSLYVASLLESDAVTIRSTSGNFLQFDGTDSAELFIGAGGITAKNTIGDTTFSISAATGDAVFKGDITGATGTFTDVIIGPGSEISGLVPIGTIYTGDEIVDLAEDANTDAAAAVVTADAAQIDATNALADAASAQADVDSAAYLSSILSGVATNIVGNSPNLIQINGTASAQLILGAGGITATDTGGLTTFAIDASNGDAVFKGNLTGASGIFSGTVTSTTQMLVTEGTATDYAGKFINSAGGSGVYGEASGIGSNAVGVFGLANSANSVGVKAYAFNSSNCTAMVAYSAFNAATALEVQNVGGGTALDIKTGYIKGDMTPISRAVDVYDLGTVGRYWENLHINKIFAYDDIEVSGHLQLTGAGSAVLPSQDGWNQIGAASERFGLVYTDQLMVASNSTWSAGTLRIRLQGSGTVELYDYSFY